MIKYNLSIAIFISCIIVFVLLLIRKKEYDIITAYIILFFGLISLNNALIWKSLESEDKELNISATKNIYYLLWAQIFFLGLGIAHEQKDYSVLILGIIILYNTYKDPKKFFVKSDVTLYSGQNLVYGFEEKMSSTLFILFIFLLFKYTDYKKTYLLISILVITYYKTIMLNEFSEIGNWLWVPGLLSIPLYLFSNYLPNLK